MSSTDESPEAIADESMEKAGGLEEIVPEPLMPIWTRFERFQSFRRTYGERYVNALELLTAIGLALGYVYWMWLYLFPPA